ncbi:type II toxin-antitoxin system PemK/MazF family toxin [Lactobacillus sp. ESL0681]|uniref:type II toxin-antitoxin system PemK/MazF family toxin n=1 Tax=Lactobacillus sp. ESL0681 TaxID=2983211 RepID=UPI0023F65F1A|nr:type II toxin-antitoxin system PemK/MazF family toxin [Lactobacillus sp. ESL0681]WEV40315.1 type II toxin-antitoxin system PemK/MazF family toxin [Lactobacillus sp. ESL0681]
MIDKEKKIQHFLKLYYSDIDNFKIKHLPSWVSFYAYQLQNEVNKTTPRYYRKYIPGEIVLVNFGTSIGQELCGPHFAVVLNKKDDKYKTVLTVVPLSSKLHSSYVSLGKELTNRMQEAVFASRKSTSNELKSVSKELSELPNILKGGPKATKEEINIITQSTALQKMSKKYKQTNAVDEKDWIFLKGLLAKYANSDHYPTLSKVSDLFEATDKLNEKLIKLNLSTNKIKKFSNEVKKHNKNTFAAVNNIKTISKLRLIDFYDKSIVSRILISDNALHKIKISLNNLI